jgi:protocatechuate 3,4-dioxygenase alpha subunit
MAEKLTPTPSQTVGPFFSLGLDRPEWNDLTAGNPGQAPVGERIIIEGRVTDGDGMPVPDAVVEIWQANAAGRYAHPEDRQSDKPLDPNFRGFGRCATDAEGRFRFTTVKPGSVPGRGNRLQAPHLNVLLFSRGLLIHLHTRIYFDGEAANAADPLLSSIEDAKVRGTLLARREAGGQSGGPARYHFDIVMQGDNETAFLEL